MPSFWRIWVASTGSSLVSMAQPLAQTGNIAETGCSLRKKRVWPLVLGQVVPEPFLERSRCIERPLVAPGAPSRMEVASYPSGKVERFSRGVNEQEHQNRRHARTRVQRSSNARADVPRGSGRGAHEFLARHRRGPRAPRSEEHTSE